MRIIIQRVSGARVSVAETVVAQIAAGMCVFVGVARDDQERHAESLARKIVNLRIFADDAGKMNRSLAEVGGEILLISQFTLYGDCSRGNRPSFAEAAPPDRAEALYLKLAKCLRGAGVSVATGIFRTHMRVELCNDGPVTLTLEN